MTRLVEHGDGERLDLHLARFGESHFDDLVGLGEGQGRHGAFRSGVALPRVEHRFRVACILLTSQETGKKGVAHAESDVDGNGAGRRDRVGRRRAGSAEEPVQGDRAEQPDAGVDPRRAAVLAQDDPGGVEGRHHGRHHAARPDGHRRQDHAAAAEARRHGFRRHGHLQDGRRRPALRGLRSRRPHARSRQGPGGLQCLPRGDRPPDAEELERQAPGLRRQHAPGVLVQGRRHRAGRLQGQEGPRLQQHDARLPGRRRRHRRQHGLRRSRAGAQQPAWSIAASPAACRATPRAGPR